MSGTADEISDVNRITMFYKQGRHGALLFKSDLSSVASFAETSYWPSTDYTVTVTCHRRNFLKRQRNETFEDTNSICVTAVFVRS